MIRFHSQSQSSAAATNAMVYSAFGESIRGQARETNEDSFTFTLDGRLGIVADGVGGNAAGEVASHLAVDVTRKRLEREFAQLQAEPDAHDAVAYHAWVESSRHRLAMALDETFVLSDQAVRHLWWKHPETQGAGTTLLATVRVGATYLIQHLGDSRAYWIRPDRVQRLTNDDTVPGLLRAQGMLSDDELQRHPLRNVLVNGIGHPSFQKSHNLVQVQLGVGERLVLCSDGLSDAVSDRNLGAIALQAVSAEAAVRALIRQAIAGGAKDDVTCIVFAADAHRSVGEVRR